MISPWRGAVLFLLSLFAACLVVWLINQKKEPRPMNPEPQAETPVAHETWGSGLSEKLKPGMRAVALRVSEVSGVAGFVMPGDRVDVLVSPPHHRAELVGQSIHVLASAQDSDEHRHGAKVASVVTLEVTPELALRLASVGAESNVGLVLRRLDEAPRKVPTATMMSAPRKMNEAHPMRIEIFRGSHKESWEKTE